MQELDVLQALNSLKINCCENVVQAGGNHLVIDHGNNIYSRYGHMRFDGVYKRVGDRVNKDEIVGLMGNSGRSEGRHLHLEIGYYSGDFDSCGPSKSFDFVVNPADYGF